MQGAGSANNCYVCILYLIFQRKKNECIIYSTLIWPFNARFPLKSHTYLNKAAGLFKYMWPFSEYQAKKGWDCLSFAYNQNLDSN